MRWCANRLLVADQSSGRTRFSMLETIRQFAEEQLAQNGASDEARHAHAKYFAEREADVLSLWDGPRQRDAYDWLNIEFANLRAAFRWSADSDDLDTAGAIATYAAFLGNRHRTIRANRLGGRTRRTRTGIRSLATRTAVQHGHAVLRNGAARRCAPLYGGRPCARQERVPRPDAVRSTGVSRWCLRVARSARTVG